MYCHKRQAAGGKVNMLPKTRIYWSPLNLARRPATALGLAIGNRTNYTSSIAYISPYLSSYLHTLYITLEQIPGYPSQSRIAIMGVPPGVSASSSQPNPRIETENWAWLHHSRKSRLYPATSLFALYQRPSDLAHMHRTFSRSQPSSSATKTNHIPPLPASAKQHPSNHPTPSSQSNS